MLDTAELFLKVMAQKRDSGAMVQPGYVPPVGLYDQSGPDSQLQPRDVVPRFHVTLQAALSYQTMYTSTSFICPIRSGKVKGEEKLG